MKLNNNADISEIVESMYKSRYDIFNEIFKEICSIESNKNNKLNLSEFLDTVSKYEISTNFLTNALNMESLYLIYNWFKYRIVYSVTNKDRTISVLSNKVSSDIAQLKFFDNFFIQYDFEKTEYIGVFVDISDNRIALGFCYLNNHNHQYSIEPVILDIKHNKQIDVRESYTHYINNSKFYLQNWINNDIERIETLNTLLSNPYIINCVEKALQIIRAIIQGYQNQSNNTNHFRENVIHKSKNRKVNVIKCSIKKKQIILVEIQNKKIINNYEFYPAYPTSTTKSPHPRREHIRKIRSSDNPSGYKEIKVKSSIIHKDKYNKSTEKIVK